MWVLLENVEKRCQNMCRLLVRLLKYGACSVTDQALSEICHNAQAMDFSPAPRWVSLPYKSMTASNRLIGKSISRR